MLDMSKKTDQLALLMAAGYNRVMAERFLQPSNYAYTCVIWGENEFDLFEEAHFGKVMVEDVKAGRVPGFEFVQYEKDELYILEVRY